MNVEHVSHAPEDQSGLDALLVHFEAEGGCPFIQRLEYSHALREEHREIGPHIDRPGEFPAADEPEVSHGCIRQELTGCHELCFGGIEFVVIAYLPGLSCFERLAMDVEGKFEQGLLPWRLLHGALSS